jgi:hypothetical protein
LLCDTITTHGHFPEHLTKFLGKMAMTDKQINKDTSADSPIVWFCVLERARQDNNFGLAATARHELEQLGVIVNYRRKQRRGSDE